MAQWTMVECGNLIRKIAAQAGLSNVEIAFNKRRQLGTCSTGWDKDGVTLVRKKIFLAEVMWSGEYRGIHIQTCPELRLLTSLHEVSHLVLDHQRGRTVSFADNPHGKTFQIMEYGVCRQYGWTPVYGRCPGYAERYINDNDDGRTFEGIEYIEDKDRSSEKI